MEISTKELNELLEAAAERGATKALETLGHIRPSIPQTVQTNDANKDIITSLPRMSSRQYQQMEEERIKELNKQSGKKFRKLPLYQDTVFMALTMNEFIAEHNHKFACKKAGLKITKLNFDINPAPMNHGTEKFIAEHNEKMRAKQQRKK